MVTQIKQFDGPDISDYFKASSQSSRMVHILSQHVMAEVFVEHRTMLLGTVRDGRIRIVDPFKVIFVRDDDQIVAEATEINEFGFGNDFSEALLDLQRTISELYFTLAEEQDRLGPDLQNIWAILQQKISKR